MAVVYIHWEETSKYVKKTEDVACELELYFDHVSPAARLLPKIPRWPMNSSRLEFDPRNGEKDLILLGDKPPT